MSKYISVPIAAAKNVAKQYDKDQVIIIAWDEEHNMVHFTTYGKTKEDCAQAAKAGEFFKKALYSKSKEEFETIVQEAKEDDI